MCIWEIVHSNIKDHIGHSICNIYTLRYWCIYTSRFKLQIVHKQMSDKKNVNESIQHQTAHRIEFEDILPQQNTLASVIEKVSLCKWNQRCIRRRLSQACPSSMQVLLLQTQNVIDALYQSNNNRLPGHKVAQPVQ